MLQRNMNTAATAVRLGLDDVLGDLQHARRQGDLGRLALLVYCEVRRWARQAGEVDLAQHSLALITENPHATRAQFLDRVDDLIQELEGVRHRMTPETRSPSQA
jgi:GMP synthase-like glutamine amidotransferase